MHDGPGNEQAGVCLQVEAVTAEQGEAARKAAQLHAACSRKDTALQDQRAALEAVHSRWLSALSHISDIVSLTSPA